MTFQVLGHSRHSVSSPERDRSPKHSAPREPFIADAVDVFLQPELSLHPDFHDGWGELRMREVALDAPLQKPPPKLTITTLDNMRISRMFAAPFEGGDAHDVHKLRVHLNDAQVVSPSHVARGLVTMNSSVVYQDLQSGEHAQVQLVYPQHAFVDQLVSVLTPLGRALLGRSCGDRIHWPDAGWLQVLEVPYQPEAEGHLHL